MDSSDIARFRYYTDTDTHPKGCWIWRGQVDTKGYGKFPVNRKWFSAHRMAYTIAHGGIPEGKWILHHCDNPLCVRPEHLYAGTAKDNAQDCVNRGRVGKRGRPRKVEGPKQSGVGKLEGPVLSKYILQQAALAFAESIEDSLRQKHYDESRRSTAQTTLQILKKAWKAAQDLDYRRKRTRH